MIRDSEVRRVLALVQRADVSDDLRRVLSVDGRGARSPLTVESFLVGGVLSLHLGPMTYANIHRVLTNEISVDSQRLLGTRYRTRAAGLSVERLITRRPIENMLNQLGNRLGHRHTSHPDLSPAQRQERAALLQSVMDRVLDAAKPTDLPATGRYALDPTGVWSWSRARSDGTSVDPDAHWGYKTAKTGEKEKFFGYDVYAFVRVQEVGASRSYPHLIERMVVFPAASDEPDSALPMVQAMTTGPYPIRTLIADRAFSYKEAQRWADRLRDLGIQQVVDLHDNDHGGRDHEGLRIVAGWPHCPAMPDHLVDIRRPPRLSLPDGTTLDFIPELDGDEPAIKGATREFVARIEQRRAYATRRVSGPNARGDERHECPACAGQCRCPLRPESMHLRPSLPLIVNPPKKEGRPLICEQRTVTVPGTVTPKVRQLLYWGSVEWIRSFARRTYVEGVFGNLKNRNTENISRGWLQVSGHARTSLMLSLAAAAYNLRIARKWNAETGLSADPLLQPDGPYLGWREVTEEDDDDDEVAS